MYSNDCIQNKCNKLFIVNALGFLTIFFLIFGIKFVSSLEWWRRLYFPCQRNSTSSKYIYRKPKKKTAASLGWQWNKKSLFNYSVGFVLHLVGSRHIGWKHRQINWNINNKLNWKRTTKKCCMQAISIDKYISKQQSVKWIICFSTFCFLSQSILFISNAV